MVGSKINDVNKKSIIGVINEVSPMKISKKGDNFIRFCIDGDWYTMWSPPDDLKLECGTCVKCEFVKVRDFNNVKYMEKVDSGSGNGLNVGNVDNNSVKQKLDVSFLSANEYDTSGRVEEDLKEIKYKLNLVIEILKDKFNLEIDE
jgi:hypothetical protein